MNHCRYKSGSSRTNAGARHVRTLALVRLLQFSRGLVDHLRDNIALAVFALIGVNTLTRLQFSILFMIFAMATLARHFHGRNGKIKPEDLYPPSMWHFWLSTVMGMAVLAIFGIAAGIYSRHYSEGRLALWVILPISLTALLMLGRAAVAAYPKISVPAGVVILMFIFVLQLSGMSGAGLKLMTAWFAAVREAFQGRISHFRAAVLFLAGLAILEIYRRLLPGFRRRW